MNIRIQRNPNVKNVCHIQILSIQSLHLLSLFRDVDWWSRESRDVDSSYFSLDLILKITENVNQNYSYVQNYIKNTYNYTYMWCIIIE